VSRGSAKRGNTSLYQVTPCSQFLTLGDLKLAVFGHSHFTLECKQFVGLRYLMGWQIKVDAECLAGMMNVSENRETPAARMHILKVKWPARYYALAFLAARPANRNGNIHG